MIHNGWRFLRSKDQSNSQRGWCSYNRRWLDIVITIKPSEEIPIELPVPIKPSLTVELVKKDLDPYLEDIDITEDDENIVVMPKRYLGRDKFAPLAEIIRLLGGSYVSAGRESKFLIPKGETESD